MGKPPTGRRSGKGWRDLGIRRWVQPDLVSCGPTCLAMVLEALGDARPLEELRDELEVNPDGGTLAVNLAFLAQGLGYGVTIHSYNLDVFDPTWSGLSPDKLIDRLEARRRVQRHRKLRVAHGTYIRFLRGGGQVRFAELTREFLMSLLDAGFPVLCGLSATYLYQCSRENPLTGRDDDIAGEPTGHFVVLSGYQGFGKRFIVVDPVPDVETDHLGRCLVPVDRLINAILLGVLTYDAVLLQIHPLGESST